MILIDGGPEGYQIFHVEKEKKMDNSEITADWARKTAQSILGEKLEKELNMCLYNIKRKCAVNKLSTSIPIYIDELTKHELEKRGFKVEKYTGDQREGSYTTISW
jgi:hypothetical protein